MRNSLFSASIGSNFHDSQKDWVFIDENVADEENAYRSFQVSRADIDRH